MEKERAILSTITNSVLSGNFLDEKTALDNAHKYDVIVSTIEEKLNDGLIDATKENNIQKVKECIRNGAFVDSTDSLGNTALHYAARNGSLNMVKLLLQAGINTDTKNLDEKIALDIAHNDDVIDFLRKTKKLNNDLIDAAKEHDIIKVTEFIKNGAYVNATDDFGNTALHYTAQNGFINASKKLISSGASAYIENKLGDTPFTLAISAGQTSILNYFVREGVVHIPECNVTTLVENMKQTNSDNRKVQSDIVKCIFSKKTEFPDKEHPGNIFLHYAVKNCHLNIFKRLIEVLNAGPNFQDDLDNTPLHYAVESDNLELVQYLVGEKHASLDIKNNTGKTAIEIAVARGSIKTLDYLINGIKIVDVPTRFIPSFTSDNGNICNVNAVKMIFEKSNSFESSGNLIMKKPWFGINSFVPHAAKYCHLNIVKYLFNERNAELNFQDELGNTALHYAAARNRLILIQYLIDEKHVSLDIQNKIGNTPAHEAAIRNDLVMLNYLKNEGKADLNIKNRSGNTPKDLLSKKNKVKFSEQINHSRKRRDIVATTNALPSDIQNGVVNLVQDNSTKSPMQIAYQKHNIFAPEINYDVINGTIILGTLVAGLLNKTIHKQPVSKDLLPPIKQSRKINNLDGALKHLIEGIRRWKMDGGPSTDCNEVSVHSNITELQKNHVALI